MEVIGLSHNPKEYKKNFRVTEDMNKKINKFKEENGYSTVSELVRDALREKIYTEKFREGIEEGIKDLKENNTQTISLEKIKKEAKKEIEEERRDE